MFQCNNKDGVSCGIPVTNVGNFVYCVTLNPQIHALTAFKC